MSQGAHDISLTSSEFSHQAYIPMRFTCDGENINPGLTISNAPAKAKSLILIVDDPDSMQEPGSNGETFIHWVVFNINPATDIINENTVPETAIQGKNSNGSIGYVGPCPPTFKHRYFFKLYALSIELDLAEGTSKAEVEAGMDGHIIEQTRLIGLYARN